LRRSAPMAAAAGPVSPTGRRLTARPDPSSVRHGVPRAASRSANSTAAAGEGAAPARPDRARHPGLEPGPALFLLGWVGSTVKVSLLRRRGEGGSRLEAGMTQMLPPLTRARTRV